MAGARITIVKREPSKVLSKRERQVGRLLLELHSNKVIADMLDIVERTVVFHMSNIHRKLGIVGEPPPTARILTILKLREMEL